MNTRDIELWLSEERAHFEEVSSQNELNNTIAGRWMFPLYTRPCMRERNGGTELYTWVLPAMSTLEESNAASVRLLCLTWFDYYTRAALMTIYSTTWQSRIRVDVIEMKVVWMQATMRVPNKVL